MKRQIYTFQDHLKGDRRLVFPPTIVIRGHSNGLVRNLELGGQDHFRTCRHVDDIRAPGSEHLALGFGGESRPLDGNDRDVFAV